MKNLFRHLKTVHTHRKWVRKYCFKMGLYWQGLTHDLSKYSLTELSMCKYYTGKKSPHQVARETIGYSPSWIHHYHMNKHHWISVLLPDAPDEIVDFLVNASFAVTKSKNKKRK